MSDRPERSADGETPGSGAAGPAWKRIAWFVLLWAGGVAAVAAVSYAIRLAVL